MMRPLYPKNSVIIEYLLMYRVLSYEDIEVYYLHASAIRDISIQRTIAIKESIFDAVTP